MAKDITLSSIIPKTMQIFGEKYKIKFAPQITDEHGTPLMGVVFYDKKLICIDDTLSDFDKLHTFLHEANHAAIAETGLTGTIDSKIEEPVVDNTAKVSAKIYRKANQETNQKA